MTGRASVAQIRRSSSSATTLGRSNTWTLNSQWEPTGQRCWCPRSRATRLYYALKAIEIPAAGYSRHYKFLKETKIPLPPLVEQKRIAGILDAADALRVKRREALAELDTLLQSTFLDMFGDPVTNPMGWEIPALSEVTDEIYRYPTYFGIVYQNEGVPEIRGELIGKDGKLDTDPSKLRFIAQATSDKFSRTQLTAGDLVMTVRVPSGKLASFRPNSAMPT